ncbi:MAG: diheme cytochrome c-553 [Deltaproteobacteria bacterium]|nr:diheme cytochrome c-553 [Deltaproteobacteria bacterium]
MQSRIMLFALVGLISLSTSCKDKIDPIERGRYLTTIMLCHDCHTPKVQGPDGLPVPDMDRQFAGHPQDAPYPTWRPSDLSERHAMALTNFHLTAWAGPWGVSFAANLTPDKETGIAEWDEATFIQALRTGKHQGQPNGRAILPPMPWPFIGQATDEDLKAIWAYLRSILPVKNQVPFPVPPPKQ